MGLTQITTGGVDDNINIDSNTLKVDGTNNLVGIGTSSPGTKLDILGGSDASVIVTVNGQDASSEYLGLGINAGAAVITAGGNGSTSNALVFKTAPSGTETERLRIDSSGRVGIGESSPAANLEITPGTGAGTLLLNHASGSMTDGALNIEVNSGGAFYETRKTGGLGHIWYAAGVERMRIDSGGRLLVGSSTVQAHANMDDLQVGDGSGNRGITISSGTSNYGTLAFGDSTDVSGVDRYAGAIEYYHSNNSMAFLTSSTSRMTLDSSGRLLVGQSSSPSSGSGQYAKIFVAGYAGGSPGGAIISIARDEAATAMSSGDTLGELIFSDNTGGTFASVKGSADAAPGSNDFPGRLTFFTTADGASSPTERVQIDRNGALKLLAGCPGIDFSGTQGAAATGSVNSETLGNYEAGQWVPTISSGSNPSSTLNIYRSAYTRVGRLVTLQLYVNFSGGDTGVFQIGNLPFAVDSTTSAITGQQASNGFDAIGTTMISNFNVSSALTNLVSYAWNNYIRLYYTPAGVNASWVPLIGTQVGGAGSGGNMIMTITYITADN